RLVQIQPIQSRKFVESLQVIVSHASLVQIGRHQPLARGQVGENRPSDGRLADVEILELQKPPQRFARSIIHTSAAQTESFKRQARKALQSRTIHSGPAPVQLLQLVELLKVGQTGRR